jgi:hypothetical protein
LHSIRDNGLRLLDSKSGRGSRLCDSTEAYPKGQSPFCSNAITELAHIFTSTSVWTTYI